ncbi:protein amalgam-like [Gigantopelta aegis]|uniref:protein amalgam-like n=1 Tax=Gigantopelta aegis TaxID=1735272 RepID=UPI001B8892D0|nr:protein amalgam-like [Gigantopelta aegis]
MFSTGKLVSLSCWSPRKVSMLWKSFLLAFVLNCDVSLDASVVLSGSSSSYAVMNESFTFTCTITQAASLVDAVQFFYTPSVSPVGIITQDGGSCSVFRIQSGYSAFCGSGTNSSSSTTKKYIYKINRATERDATDWWCGLNTATTLSEKFSLPVYSGRNSVTFSPRSPATVGGGNSLTVTCNANCTPSCSFSWTRGSQNLSASSKLQLTNIAKNHEGAYTCTAKNIVSSYVKSSNFTLIVKDDPKRMSALGAGAISGIVIAVVLALAVPTVWIIYKRNIQKKQNGEGKNERTTTETPI